METGKQRLYPNNNAAQSCHGLTSKNLLANSVFFETRTSVIYTIDFW